jgi:hypothetical protein
MILRQYLHTDPVIAREIRGANLGLPLPVEA